MGAPYKGGEQEELSRASLQRRGVRRDVRHESRLGEGGGEVGAAHEVEIEAAGCAAAFGDSPHDE